MAEENDWVNLLKFQLFRDDQDNSSVIAQKVKMKDFSLNYHTN